MSNNLKESMKNNITKLNEFGWSVRRISRELGIHRKTVSKYILENSKCTISTTGESEGTESKCTIPTTGESEEAESECTIATAGQTGRKSTCELHDTFIRENLQEGLSAQRIYQDLCLSRGFAGSYEAVKRYAQKLRKRAKIPFRRMEKLPGEECQVDYGTGGWVIDVNGKRHKTHVLRVTLSYSRKAYSEASFTQSTDNFLRGIENAFRVFGGAPETTGDPGSSIIVGGQDTNNLYVNFIQILLSSIPVFRILNRSLSLQMSLSVAYEVHHFGESSIRIYR